jgi:hypothetical protein
MSLYNMLHGHHPIAGDLLGILGYTKETHREIPRFRDVFLFPDEIRLLTRTGGGNRDNYMAENESLKKRDGFLRDWDDDFDNTFAWWAYKWPEALREQLTMILEAIEESRPELLPESLEEPTNRAIEQIGKHKPA